MKPGEHIVIVGDDVDALEARRAGLHLRDTLAIFAPGPVTLFAYLFRAPLEGTIAETCLKHGCGGLNIDGCRVKHSGAADFEHHREMVERIKARGGSMANSWKNSSDLSGASDVSSAGRWPTNAVLVHGPSCIQMGEKKVRSATNAYSPAHKTGSVWGRFKGNVPAFHYADVEGKETVSTYNCQSNCPIRLLDEMSSELTSGSFNGVRAGMGYHGAEGNVGSGYVGNTGAASRFYPQFGSLREAFDWLRRLIDAT